MPTLYRNGSVYSPADPGATAILVDGDRVAWVGDEEAADGYVGPGVGLVDLDGALVTPAFVDSHVHVSETGLASDGADLTGSASLQEALRRVSEHAHRSPGEVLLGFGWEDERWPEGRPPSRPELDEVAAGAPVYLARRDVHSAVVSSALLAADPDIASAVGYSDGLLRRDAHHLARRAALDLVPESRLRRLRRSVLSRAAEAGFGAVHEIGAPHISTADDLATVIALGQEPDLPDVVGYWGELGGVARAVALGAAGAAGDLNIDGSLGSRTARLASPYADAPNTRGHLYLDLDVATDHVVACTEAGIQAGFHCIGDEAVRTAVAALAAAADRCGRSAVIAARHRLEHVEALDLDLIPELARLGVVASVQPVFDELWGGAGGTYAARLGVERAGGLNPFAAMARAGVILAFGSDSPVTPIGGWEMVRAAVYHHNPAHRVSVRSAFAAATRGGWQAARVDDAGVLAPGMLASFAVWDAPAGAEGLPDLTPGTRLPVCLRTVIGGNPAFTR